MNNRDTEQVNDDYAENQRIWLRIKRLKTLYG